MLDRYIAYNSNRSTSDYNHFIIIIIIIIIIFKIYLFLAALGLHCHARDFSSCGERGLLFIAVCGLLIAVASLAVEHGL